MMVMMMLLVTMVMLVINMLMVTTTMRTMTMTMMMMIEYDLIWHGFPHRQLSIIDGGTQKSFVVYIKASSPLLQNTEHKNLREIFFNVNVTDICQVIDINDI